MGSKGAITTSDAHAIAKKLKAKYEDARRPHTLAIVYYQGKRITQFGIRRGSKDQGHGHIPGAIFLSPRDTRLFADCSISYEEWVKRMAEKQKI